MPRFLKLTAPDGSPVLLNADVVKRVQRASGGCNIDDCFYKNSYEEVEEFLLPSQAKAHVEKSPVATGHEEIRHAEKGHATKGHSDR